MRSNPIDFLQLLHRWVATGYLTVHGAFSNGWYEAFEHAPAPLETAVCPVKQLIGISVHEKTQ
ncbi:conserved hypothetical protein [Limnobacter sp. 130]|jgi:hypothetical protein|uniref:hypothetical protein n=1 Tax=Limnobacter sp. 130 TaxID=2653147 RepID=UPI0012F2814D|nr:hypothetical protein [Limnobacter sp. 130]VWX35475.1 conserved hypothetical protein [Limnobacter sp. 130]